MFMQLPYYIPNMMVKGSGCGAFDEKPGQLEHMVHVSSSTSKASQLSVMHQTVQDTQLSFISSGLCLHLQFPLSIGVNDE